jgi:hypothetical protein
VRFPSSHKKQWSEIFFEEAFLIVINAHCTVVIMNALKYECFINTYLLEYDIRRMLLQKEFSPNVAYALLFDRYHPVS